MPTAKGANDYDIEGIARAAGTEPGQQCPIEIFQAMQAHNCINVH